jgi:hypothetical protein
MIIMNYIVSGSYTFLMMLPFILFAQGEGLSADARKKLDHANIGYFIENKGQWPSEVKYLTRIGGMNAWITTKGVVYDHFKKTGNSGTAETGISGHVLAMNMEGANTDAEFTALQRQQGYYNYIRGKNPTIYSRFVAQYAEVVVNDIYPGIDIRYYFDNGFLRYDYVAEPGADLTLLRLKIYGAGGYKVNESGELTIGTSLGTIVHGRLYAYQEMSDKQNEVACAFSVESDGQIGFTTGKYNPALALVIDPLVFSTFIGGSGEEYCTSIAIDEIGNSYITGFTRSTDFPVTLGAYDTASNLGSDVFVIKLDENGVSMIYSTYISADSNEAGNSIAVDNYGNAYITGYTQSANYPTTAGAYDETYNGGSNFGGDGFITKLDASGSTLVYSTFIGGTSNDYGNSIAIDANDDAYITGYSKSINYPTTPGVYDDSLNGTGAFTDLIITKINATGTALIYSTFIGGKNDEVGNSIAVDTAGNAYVTGFTASADYPTTVAGYDNDFNGGFKDAFVVKMNAGATAMVYSTFLGGNSFDVGTSIKLDGKGNALLAGYTGSTDFPTSAGTFDSTANGGWDAFIARMNWEGSLLTFSTYLGGGDDDLGYSISLDDKGNPAIAGSTASPNFPVTTSALDASYNGGTTFGNDGFLSILNLNGNTMTYSTYLGGADEDYCTAIALDAIGTVYYAGNTFSTDFPTSGGSYDVSHNGDYDVFAGCIFFPLKQATGISVKNITGVKADISFVKGTGAKRAVFVKETAWGVANPVTDVSYQANDSFGLGSQIGTSGWYCVYNDTGASFELRGLNQLTTYRIMVCEYVGLPGNEHYNIDSVNKNPSGFTTIYSTPTIQASNINITNLTDTSFTINVTKGNGPKRIIFMKMATSGYPVFLNNTTYNAKTVFGQGSQIGLSGWFCVYNDTGSTVTVTKLLPGKTYRMMVFEYNGISGKEQYLRDSSTGNPLNQLVSYLKPVVQASDIVFHLITESSVNFSYTRGSGTACLVLITSGDTPVPPLVDGKTYNMNSVIGTSGWVVKYKGSLKQYSILGLNLDTFRLMVCEYNGMAGFEKYNTDIATNNPREFTTILVGVNEPLKMELSVYPNPASGSFIVENASGAYLTIYNSLGKELRSTYIANTKESVSTSSLSKGVYLLRFEKDGVVVSRRLLVQ